MLSYYGTSADIFPICARKCAKRGILATMSKCILNQELPGFDHYLLRKSNIADMKMIQRFPKITPTIDIIAN
jgi:hypothetical protein